MIATSLNMDLAEVFESLSEEQKKLPLLILADQVKILRPVKIVNPQLTIQTRKIIMSAQAFRLGNTTLAHIEPLRDASVEIYALEVVNGPLTVWGKSIEIKKCIRKKNLKKIAFSVYVKSL